MMTSDININSKNKIESWRQVVSRMTSIIRPEINNLHEKIFFQSGGPHPKECVEVVGETNVGKTQFIIEMIAKAVLPIAFEGKGTHVVVIETEHSFQIFKMMAVLEKHIHTYAQKVNMKIESDRVIKIIHESLKNITVLKCYTSEELELAIISLDQMLLDNSCISMVVIDSVASFYWTECTDQSLIRIDTYLRNLIIKVKKITTVHGVVFMYTRPTYFSTKFKNSTEAKEHSVGVAAIESELDYRIELIEDSHFDEENKIKDEHNYIAKINVFKLNLTALQRYSLDSFGIDWKT